ncbi:rRNA adenine N-6-methyltransferase family protein [Candidatus Vidania fulgoroideorum]
MYLSSDVVFLAASKQLTCILAKVYLYLGVVIEVGSGIGNLIFSLLNQFSDRIFYLFEIERVFCTALLQLLLYQNILVFNVDFLTFVFFPYMYVTFISNIPFSISMVLLYKLLCYRSSIICQYLMLQLELYWSIFRVPSIKFFIYSFYYFCDLLVCLQGSDFEPVVAVSTVFFVMYPKYIPYETDNVYFFIVARFFMIQSLLGAVTSFFRVFTAIYSNQLYGREFYFCMLVIYLRVF